MSAGNVSKSLTTLHTAIDAVPRDSAWAVGVSGGADSVALLRLLLDRPDLRLHVVHLDHQTRGPDSTGDAEFVRTLCARWNVPCTVRLRAEVERGIEKLPANPSARFRALRVALFREVVAAHALAGVILAHHADDLAETVLQRLLRGSGPFGLVGMPVAGRLGDLAILRPLLVVSRRSLREYLAAIDQPWREDASNALPKYQRNRVRVWLAERPEVTPILLRLAEACRAWKDWTDDRAPELPADLPVNRVRLIPAPIARVSLARWLTDAGMPPDRIDRATLDRMLAWVGDAASSPRIDLPGQIRLTRRRGVVTAGRSVPRKRK